MKPLEIWKDVVGYEGLYKVSNRGDLYSVERKDSIGKECGGRILRPIDNRYGYLQVMLYKNGISKHKKIHRLVSEAFLPNPNNYSEINHRDEVKTNNNVENLEWCTRKHNINHGTRTERSAQSKSKKVKAINVETGEVITFNSPIEAGNKGYYIGSVYLACKGNYRDGNRNLIGGDGRTYKGHRWSYEEEELIDAVGDTYVTLVILCQQLGIEITDCVSAAYNEIKDRKGKLVDGTFVKEE